MSQCDRLCKPTLAIQESFGGKLRRMLEGGGGCQSRGQGLLESLLGPGKVYPIPTGGHRGIEKQTSLRAIKEGRSVKESRIPTVPRESWAPANSVSRVILRDFAPDARRVPGLCERPTRSQFHQNDSRYLRPLDSGRQSAGCQPPTGSEHRFCSARFRCRCRLNL